MENTILIATIGFSDPIRGEKDGPLLHIVRHYRPEKVYLICSDKIFNLEKKWHSNERAIHMLDSKCNVTVMDMETDDLHSYDTISKRILRICEKIKQENLNKKILLNISSGTQQMNTILCLLSMVDQETYLPIQVSSKDNQNTKTFNPEKDSLEEWFEVNMDNEPDAENRCVQPKLLNFKKPVTQFQIESLIRNYDYSAAYTLYEMNRDLFIDDTGILLLHAKKRLNLEYKEASKLSQQLGLKNELYPVKRGDISELIEFYLSMDIKQKRGELSDMTLRLEIITEYIAKYMLENIMKIKLEDITTQKKKKNSILYNTSREKAEKKMKGITTYLNGKFRTEFDWGKPISARTMVYILEYFIQKTEFQKYKTYIEELGKFLDIVEQVRNPAAHTIMAVTDEKIRSAYGKDSDILMKKIEKVLRFIFGNEAPEEAYHIYDHINERVVKLLQKEG